MKITQPFKDTDIYIANNLIPQDELELLQKFLKNELHPIYYKEIVDGIAQKIRNMAQFALSESFPEIKNPVFSDPKEFVCHLPGEGMRVHHDGVPGKTVAEQVLNAGSVFYVNDDFSGGETFYPNLDIIFKPIAGSLIMHPGKVGYEHGVKEVKNIARYTLTTFMFDTV